MYENTKPATFATIENGQTFAPVATLRDQGGGVVHIGVDDGCYVAYVERGGVSRPTTHLFPELHAVLAVLPDPRTQPRKPALRGAN